MIQYHIFCKFYVLLTVLTCILGCASTLSKPYTDTATKACNQYELYKNCDDFCVAVSPVESEKELIDLFGTNLVAQGILPVLVILENRTANETIMVDQDGFVENSEDRRNTASDDASGRSAIQSVQGDSDISISTPEMVGRSIMQGGILLGPLFLWAILDEKHSSQVSNTNFIRQNMVRRSLQEETLLPGESQSGFLYCQLKNTTEDEMPIYVRVFNLGEKKTTTIPFTIKFNSTTIGK